MITRCEGLGLGKLVQGVETQSLTLSRTGSSKGNGTSQRSLETGRSSPKM